MAVYRNQKLILKNCQLILTSTVFEQAGDFVEADVSNTDNQINKQKYFKRHVVHSGAFEASFPGTDELSEYAPLATIFPTRESYALKDSKFRVTALEDNSIYYCVIPQNPMDHLDINSVNLVNDQQFNIEQGGVYFIFGQTYLLNSQQKFGNQVLVCENSSAELISQGNTKVLQFKIKQSA